MQSVAEQRHDHRYATHAEVELETDQGSTSGRMLNISLGGARLEVGAELALRPGARLVVTFRIPTCDAPLRATAEVRWQNSYELGVQFVTGFRAKETWALGQYLRRLPPQ